MSLNVVAPLLCFFSFLLMEFPTGDGVGAGVLRYNTKSRSAADAREMGIFIQHVNIEEYRAVDEAKSVKLEEAWLEELVERDEFTLTRIRRAGTRLCIRFTDPERFLRRNMAATYEAVDKAAHLEGDGKLYGAENIVFASLSYDTDFPQEGRVTMHRFRDDKEIVSFRFEVP